MGSGPSYRWAHFLFRTWAPQIPMTILGSRCLKGREIRSPAGWARWVAGSLSQLVQGQHPLLEPAVKIPSGVHSNAFSAARVGLRVRASRVAFDIGEEAGRRPEHRLLIAAVRAPVRAIH